MRHRDMDGESERTKYAKRDRRIPREIERESGTRRERERERERRRDGRRQTQRCMHTFVAIWFKR